jgi:CheY-like chemotaxis protein
MVPCSVTLEVGGTRREDQAQRDPSSRAGNGVENGERKPRVLIVEDHADTREIYAWCMRAAGWHVEVATNGVAAVVLATATEPDVIVMDLNLPALDGIAATRALKSDERTANIPVVACTAYLQEHGGDVEDAWFEELVTKPCTAEDLRDVVEMVALRTR